MGPAAVDLLAARVYMAPAESWGWGHVHVPGAVGGGGMSTFLVLLRGEGGGVSTLLVLLGDGGMSTFLVLWGNGGMSTFLVLLGDGDMSTLLVLWGWGPGLLT